MALPSSLASLSWKDAHVGLRAAVEQGPSDPLPTIIFLREWPRLPFTARIGRAHSDRVRSASKKGPGRPLLFPPSSLASLSWKGTHVGLSAAVERAHSYRARSGSTGPMWVSFQSFFIVGAL